MLEYFADIEKIFFGLFDLLGAKNDSRPGAHSGEISSKWGKN